MTRKSVSQRNISSSQATRFKHRVLLITLEMCQLNLQEKNNTILSVWKTATNQSRPFLIVYQNKCTNLNFVLKLSHRSCSTINHGPEDQITTRVSVITRQGVNIDWRWIIEAISTLWFWHNNSVPGTLRFLILSKWNSSWLSINTLMDEFPISIVIIRWGRTRADKTVHQLSFPFELSARLFRNQFAVNCRRLSGRLIVTATDTRSIIKRIPEQLNYHFVYSPHYQSIQVSRCSLVQECCD